MPTLDLNADLGESYGAWTMGNDAALLGLVTSANVACGFHGGDPGTIHRTVALAADHGVSIGAHVSYRDLVGFGRRFLDASPDELTADVLYQLGALAGICKAAGTSVRYVKPHGALYNAIVDHEAHAAAVVAAILAFDPTLPVVGLPGSAVLRRAAAAGLPTVTEFFADRAYRADATLVPRGEPGAVLTDEAAVVARVRRFAATRMVTTSDGTDLTLDARTVCLHGDNPEAVVLARAIRSGLEADGVHLAAFA